MTTQTTPQPMAQGPGENEDAWGAAAQYFEYSTAADPIGSGVITAIPPEQFLSDLYTGGPTRLVPLDLSSHLNTSYPATSPALLSSFIRIMAGEHLETAPNATSELYYCISGRGWSEVNGSRLNWKQGDFVTLPSGSSSTHHGEEDSAFYWVHDEPLLSYLGVRASEPRFRPTLYPRERAVEQLERVAADPEATNRSRVSVLLANEAMDQTLTVTHVLWAMFGILPEGKVQPPHRHQSVALDFILDCEPGCYSLLGDGLNAKGDLVNPERVDWHPYSAFVTPPGKWHSHHNESGADAHLIPIQDAGLQTYLRTLDIRFTGNKRQDAVAEATSADISPSNSRARSEASAS